MHWKPKFITLQRTLLILKIKNPDLFIILLLFHNSFHYFSFIFKRTHLESMATKYFFFIAVGLEHWPWYVSQFSWPIFITIRLYVWYWFLCLILDNDEFYSSLSHLVIKRLIFFLHEQNLRFNRWNCIFFCSWWPMTCSYGKISTVVLCKAIWITFSNKLI